VGNLLCEASENFKAYGVAGHRHLPEIRQGLTAIAGKPINIVFVPHLTPMIRGIHATLYSVLTKSDIDLQSIFETRYANEPFVDLLPEGSHPETRSVRGNNLCRLAVHRAPDSNTVIVLSVIDNLVKGAAGQAIQNMNLMFEFPETAGLEHMALLP
jgi:N-acetyl-gamma-glutamyl-phosphate reductase